MTPEEKKELFGSQSMRANVNYIKRDILQNLYLSDDDAINIYFDGAYNEECLQVAMDIDNLGYHVNNFKFRNISKNIANKDDFDIVRDLTRDSISKMRAVYKTILKSVKYKNDVEIVGLGIPRIIHLLVEQTQSLKKCIESKGKNIKSTVEKIYKKVVDIYNDDILKGMDDITKVNYSRGFVKPSKKRVIRQSASTVTSTESKLKNTFSDFNNISSNFIGVIDSVDPSMAGVPRLQRQFVDLVDNVGETISIVDDAVASALSSGNDVYIDSVEQQLRTLVDAMQSVINSDGNDANVISLCVRGNSSVIGIVNDLSTMDVPVNATQITA